ncbi:MAG TPA: DUF4321 domain-containing protein [Firmicutes bacterium]|nr:DUF4321 domain-containing protein [Bacillota bacterium]
MRQHDWLRWILIIMVGALAGTLLGEWLGEYVPLLGKAVSWGFRLSEVHLADVLTFDFGLTLRFNAFTLIGIVLAAWALRRA